MSRFKHAVCPRYRGSVVRKTEIADIAARRAYVERAKAFIKLQMKVKAYIKAQALEAAE